MNALFEHLRLASPSWLLLLLPAIAMLFLRRRRGAEAAVVFPNLSVLVSLGGKTRSTAGNIGIPLAYTALILAITAMARPVWRQQFHSRTASGIDIMIALDVSLSMDIDDFVRNGRRARRIDVAKMVVDDFIKWRPDDRMGLVVFAGRPRDASPVTLDHDWLRNALSLVQLNDPQNLGSVQEQGTAIGSAIAAASSRLDARDAKSKIIVLITDGASNSGKISPVEAAELARTLGIKIYTIAIGTTKGRVKRNIMRFPYQEFDLPTLRRISSLTNAEHYWAQDLESLRATFQTIDQLEKTDAKRYTVIEDVELFPHVLGASLLAALAAATLLSLRPPPSP
ncbi:MAG: VWA domain-containing protein [Verrucomicrobiota bacterium JB025]|nr:VWA domain-containing protein [Verrucomicrobiota bacterium JB025]